MLIAAPREALADGEVLFNIKPGGTNNSTASNKTTFSFTEPVIIAPAGEKIQTLMVSFSESAETNDEIKFANLNGTATTTYDGFTYIPNAASPKLVAVITATNKTVDDWNDLIKKNLTVTLNTTKKTNRKIRFYVSSELEERSAAYSTATGHYYEWINDTHITWYKSFKKIHPNSKLTFDDSSVTYSIDDYGQNTRGQGYWFLGQPGYFATITQEEEQKFLYGIVNRYAWLGATCWNSFSHAALYQRTGIKDTTNNLPAGEWVYYWIDGPEKGMTFPTPNCKTVAKRHQEGDLEYQHWLKDEPNNSTAANGKWTGSSHHGEYFLHFYTDGYWNDYANSNDKNNNAYTNLQGFMVEYDPPIITGQTSATVDIALNPDPNSADLICSVSAYFPSVDDIIDNEDPIATINSNPTESTFHYAAAGNGAKLVNGRPATPGTYTVYATSGTKTSNTVTFTVLGKVTYYYNYNGVDADDVSRSPNEVFHTLRGKSKDDVISVVSDASGVPTRKFHTFLGWSTHANATTAEYPVGSESTLALKGDDTDRLYAIWEGMPVTVTYYYNYAGEDVDGVTRASSDVFKTVSSMEKGDYANVVSLSGVPTRKYYTFLGWSTNATATTPDYPVGEIGTHYLTDDVAFYAVWGETAPSAALAKSSTNEMAATESRTATRVGDSIRYTITASNNRSNSLWRAVTITDTLPVWLSYNDDAVLTANEETVPNGVSVSNQAITARAGDIEGNKIAVLTFTATVVKPVGLFAVDNSGYFMTADESAYVDLTNTAKAQGTNGPTDPVEAHDGGGRASAIRGIAVRHNGGTYAIAMLYTNNNAQRGDVVRAKLREGQGDGAQQTADAWAVATAPEGKTFAGWTTVNPATAGPHTYLNPDATVGDHWTTVWPLYVGSSEATGNVAIIVHRRSDGAEVMRYTPENTAAGHAIVDDLARTADAPAATDASKTTADAWAAGDGFLGWTEWHADASGITNVLLSASNTVTGIHHVTPIYTSDYSPSQGIIVREDTTAAKVAMVYAGTNAPVGAAVRTQLHNANGNDQAQTADAWAAPRKAGYTFVGWSTQNPATVPTPRLIDPDLKIGAGTWTTVYPVYAKSGDGSGSNTDVAIVVHRTSDNAPVMLYTPSRTAAANALLDNLGTQADAPAATDTAIPPTLTTADAWAVAGTPAGAAFLGWTHSTATWALIGSGETVRDQAVDGVTHVWPVYTSDFGTAADSRGIIVRDEQSPYRVTMLYTGSNALAADVVSQKLAQAANNPAPTGQTTANAWANETRPADAEFVGWTTTDPSKNEPLAYLNPDATVGNAWTTVWPVYVRATGADTGVAIIVHRRGDNAEMLKYTPSRTAKGNKLLDDLASAADAPAPTTDKETSGQAWAEACASADSPLLGWTQNPATNVLVGATQQVQGVEHVWPVYKGSFASGHGIVVHEPDGGQRAVMTYTGTVAERSGNANTGSKLLDDLALAADNPTPTAEADAYAWALAHAGDKAFVGWSRVAPGKGGYPSMVASGDELGATDWVHVYPVYVDGSTAENPVALIVRDAYSDVQAMAYTAAQGNATEGKAVIRHLTAAPDRPWQAWESAEKWATTPAINGGGAKDGDVFVGWTDRTISGPGGYRILGADVALHGTMTVWPVYRNVVNYAIYVHYRPDAESATAGDVAMIYTPDRTQANNRLLNNLVLDADNESLADAPASTGNAHNNATTWAQAQASAMGGGAVLLGWTHTPATNALIGGAELVRDRADQEHVTHVYPVFTSDFAHAGIVVHDPDDKGRAVMFYTNNAVDGNARDGSYLLADLRLEADNEAPDGSKTACAWAMSKTTATRSFVGWTENPIVQGTAPTLIASTDVFSDQTWRHVYPVYESSPSNAQGNSAIIVRDATTNVQVMAYTKAQGSTDAGHVVVDDLNAGQPDAPWGAMWSAARAWATRSASDTTNPGGQPDGTIFVGWTDENPSTHATSRILGRDVRLQGTKTVWPLYRSASEYTLVAHWRTGEAALVYTPSRTSADGGSKVLANLAQPADAVASTGHSTAQAWAEATGTELLGWTTNVDDNSLIGAEQTVAQLAGADRVAHVYPVYLDSLGGQGIVVHDVSDPYPSVMFYTGTVEGKDNAALGSRVQDDLRTEGDQAAATGETVALAWALAHAPQGKAFVGWSTVAPSEQGYPAMLPADAKVERDAWTHVYPVYDDEGTTTSTYNAIIVRDPDNNAQVMAYTEPYGRAHAGDVVTDDLATEPDPAFSQASANAWAEALRADGGGRASDEWTFVGWTDDIAPGSPTYHRLLGREVTLSGVKTVWPVYSASGADDVAIVVHYRTGEAAMLYTPAHTARGNAILDNLKLAADAPSSTGQVTASDWAEVTKPEDARFVGWTRLPLPASQDAGAENNNVGIHQEGADLASDDLASPDGERYDRLIGRTEMVQGVEHVYPVYTRGNNGIIVRERTGEPVMMYTKAKGKTHEGKSVTRKHLPVDADAPAPTDEATALEWALAKAEVLTRAANAQRAPLSDVSGMAVASDDGASGTLDAGYQDPTVTYTYVFLGWTHDPAHDVIIPATEKFSGGWEDVYPVFGLETDVNVGIIVRSLVGSAARAQSADATTAAEADEHPVVMTYMHETYDNCNLGDVMVSRNADEGVASPLIAGRLGMVPDDPYDWQSAYEWAKGEGLGVWAVSNGYDADDCTFLGWTDDIDPNSPTYNRILGLGDIVTGLHTVYPVYQHIPKNTDEVMVVVHKRNGDVVLNYTSEVGTTQRGNALVANLSADADRPFDEYGQTWTKAQQWAEDNCPAGKRLAGWTHDPTTNVLIGSAETVDGVEHVYPVYEDNGNTDCGIIVCDRWDEHEVTTYLHTNDNCELGQIIANRMGNKADVSAKDTWDKEHDTANQWAAAVCPAGYQHIGWTDCIDPNSVHFNRLLGVNDVVTGLHHVYPVYAKVSDPAPEGAEVEATKAMNVRYEQDKMYLDYVVEAHNIAAENWENIMFMDMLPRNSEVVAGTVRLALLDGSNTEIPADWTPSNIKQGSKYSKGTYVVRTVKRNGQDRRLLCYRVFNPGAVKAGQRLVLCFTAVRPIGEKYLVDMEEAENIAYITGWPNPVDPGSTDPTDPADPSGPTDPADPTDPSNPGTPTDPTDPIDPAEPDPTDPTISIWTNPVYPNPGGVSAYKTAQASEDGMTIHYVLDARNASPTRTYTNVTLSDTLPVGTQVVPGSVRLRVLRDNVAPTGPDRPTDEEIAAELRQAYADLKEEEAAEQGEGGELAAQQDDDPGVTSAASHGAYGGADAEYVVGGVASDTTEVSVVELAQGTEVADGVYLVDAGNVLVWRGTTMEMEPGMHYVLEFDLMADDAALANQTVNNQFAVTAWPKDDPNNPVGALSTNPEGKYGPLVDIVSDKTGKNLTSPDGKNRVGDYTEWTITAKSTGVAPAHNVVVSDTLPEGLDYENGTAVAKVDGKVVAESDVTYDPQTRTVAVTIAQLDVGSTVVVTVNAKITAAAVDKTVVNTAIVTSDDGFPSPHDPWAPLPGDGTVLPSPDDKPLPPDELYPEEKDARPVVQKDVTELGPRILEDDILEYNVTLHNPNVGKPAWEELTVFDSIPRELVYIRNSLTITYPDGAVERLPDDYYHADTHTIEVPIERIDNGETCIVTYRAGIESMPTELTVNVVELQGIDDDAVEGIPGASAATDLRDLPARGIAAEVAVETARLGPARPGRPNHLAATGDPTASAAALATVGAALLAAARRRRH